MYSLSALTCKYLKNCRSYNIGYEAPPVHITREKFENTALFPRLNLPSTLIRHENGAFRKHDSNRVNLKMLAQRFRVDGKHFENGAFRKR